MEKLRCVLIVFCVLLIAATQLPAPLQDLPYAQEVAQIRAPPQAAPFQIQRVGQQAKQPYIVRVKSPKEIAKLRAQNKNPAQIKQLQETIRAFTIYETQQTPRHVYKSTPSFFTHLTPTQVTQLQNNPFIESITPDMKVEVHLQDSVGVIRADELRNESIQSVPLTGKGMGVCVIDTGIDYTHPAFGSCSAVGASCPKVPAGINYISGENSSDPLDYDDGHGTHVAGIIAANSTDMQGVAPEAHILAARALNASGGSFADIIAAIEWCTTNKETYNVSVISMSLGTKGTTYAGTCDSQSSSFTDAVNAAVAENISVYASSGNEGSSSQLTLPACITNVTAITSSRKDDSQLSSFANRNDQVLLTAPGSSINSTYRTNTKLYEVLSGTSMSAPHVSAATAILYQYLNEIGRTRTPNQLVTVLNDTGVSIYDSASARNYQRIDVFSAYTHLTNFLVNTTASYPTTWQNESFTVSLTPTVIQGSVDYTTYKLNNNTWINATSIAINTSKNHTLQFYSVDTEGVAEQTKTIHPLLDAVSPNTTTTYNGNWTNNFSLQLVASDNLSGVNYTRYNINNASWIYNQTVSVSAPGNYTITYQSIDIAGNREVEQQIVFLADNTTPMITVVNNNWSTTPYTITLQANDTYSGIRTLTYTKQNQTSQENATIYVNESGNQSIQLIAVDNANNTYNKTIYSLLDTIAPSSTVSNQTSWTNTTYNQTITATDDYSGVANITYIQNNTTNTSQVVYLNESGNYSITYFAYDIAGNKEQNNTLIALVDVTAPTSSTNIPINWTNKTVVVSINFTDAHSSVQNSTVTYHNVTYQNFTNYTLNQTQKTNFTLYAIDHAGNTLTQVVTAYIDKTPPNTTITAPTNWSNTNYTLNLTASDAHSNVNYTQYYNNSSWMLANNITFSDGVHELLYRSVDFAGNIEATKNYTVYIDTTKPVISNITTNPTRPTHNQPFNVTAVVTDFTNVSVHIRIQNTTPTTTKQNNTYKTNFTLPADTYTIRIQATDSANNTRTVQKNVTVYYQATRKNIFVNDTVIDEINTTNTSLRLKTNQTTKSNVTIQASNAQPADLTTLADGIRFNTVTLSNQTKQHLEWAILTMKYAQSRVLERNESTLQVAYYNESTSSWINSSQAPFINNIQINTQTNTVTINTSQFSSYALSAQENQEPSQQEEETQEESESSSSSSSGGGGGGSSGGGGGGAAASTTSQATQEQDTAHTIQLQRGVLAQINFTNHTITRITFVSNQTRNASFTLTNLSTTYAYLPKNTSVYYNLTHPTDLQVTNVTLYLHTTQPNISLYRRAQQNFTELLAIPLTNNTYKVISPGLSEFALAPANKYALSKQNESTISIQKPTSQQPTPTQPSMPETTIPYTILIVFLGLATLLIPAVIIEDPWSKK